MTTTLIVFGIIVYVVGIFTYIFTETMENVESHEGGFLGMGYVTHDNREMTAKDARISLLWPFLLIFWFVKALLWVLHDCLSFIPLLLGFNYKDTRAYKYIDKNLLN